MGAQELGGYIKTETLGFFQGLTFFGPDFASLCQLFFDNLSTLLAVSFALIGLVGDQNQLINDIVWRQITPACGLTLALGNMYFSWQATRLARKYGRPFTAQPYGLNTTAALPYVFGVFLPIFATLGGFGSCGADPNGAACNEAVRKAYYTCCAANFLQGCINMVLGIFGQHIMKFMPVPSLLVPLAGVAFTWLGVNQVTGNFSAPIVGFVCVWFVFVGWWTGITFGWNKYRIPPALLIIILGTALGWATGYNQPEPLRAVAKTYVNPQWLIWNTKDLFSKEIWSLLGDYLGVALPMSIAATVTTVMCLVSARKAGDAYPIRETMIVDGFGTVIVSFFGSMMGTVVYIGHPAHKRQGALTGYSFMNGWLYFIFAMFGLFALISRIVNACAVGPIILFVGLMINEEAIRYLPPRHWVAYVFGLYPAVSDFAMLSTNAFIANAFYQTAASTGNEVFMGLFHLSKGPLLISMLWVGIIVYTIDRHWLKAAGWCVAAAFFSSCGVIHQERGGYETIFAKGFSADWKFDKPWCFFVGYLMIAAICILFYIARRLKPDWLEPPIEDEFTQSIFDTWWDCNPATEENSKGNEEWWKAKAGANAAAGTAAAAGPIGHKDGFI